MIPNTQRSVDWMAPDGDDPWGTVLGYPGDDRLEDRPSVWAEEERFGHDLLSFLVDFRSARQDEAVKAVEAATAGRRPAASAVSAPRGTDPARPAESAYERAGTEFYDPYAGSDAQVSPEWWLASDGRWYAPEVHPDAQAAPQPHDDVAATPVHEQEVGAAESQPVHPLGKLRLLAARPRLGVVHSARTATL